MGISTSSQAIMLLTAALRNDDGQSFHRGGKTEDLKPLSVKEWARFALWLHHNKLTPSALLQSDIKALLSGWTDKAITLARLEYLLSRGVALALLLERWERAGLWVITRADDEYPNRLKNHLRQEAPPLLFGCGNKELLNGGGVAVVGSRNAAQEDLSFATRLAKDIAQQGGAIISGGARGIDQSAMMGALQNKGKVIGVMAHNLLLAATSAQYRPHLLAGRLTLLTPFNPEADFNVANAMARNRYTYCLADAAVAVCCVRNKGGTWQGATENLNYGWVPLWVKNSTDKASGNASLVQLGARLLPDKIDSVSFLLE